MRKKLGKLGIVPRVPLKAPEIPQTFCLWGRIQCGKGKSTKSLRRNTPASKVDFKIPRKGKRRGEKKYKLYLYFVSLPYQIVLYYLGFFSRILTNPKTTTGVF